MHFIGGEGEGGGCGGKYKIFGEYLYFVHPKMNYPHQEAYVYLILFFYPSLFLAVFFYFLEIIGGDEGYNTPMPHSIALGGGL